MSSKMTNQYTTQNVGQIICYETDTFKKIYENIYWFVSTRIECADSPQGDWY